MSETTLEDLVDALDALHDAVERLHKTLRDQHKEMLKLVDDVDAAASAISYNTM